MRHIHARSRHRQNTRHAASQLHQNPAASLHLLRQRFLPQLAVRNGLQQWDPTDFRMGQVGVHGVSMVSPDEGVGEVGELQGRVV